MLREYRPMSLQGQSPQSLKAHGDQRRFPRKISNTTSVFHKGKEDYLYSYRLVNLTLIPGTMIEQ